MKLEDFNNLFKQGEFFHFNRTHHYLAPILHGHGSEFIKKLGSISQTGIYVDDLLCTLDEGRYLFLLVNVKKSLATGKMKDFDLAMSEFKSDKSYAYDYPFGELFGGKLHAIVFHVPEKYHNAYDEFTKFKIKDSPVKYSKMFTLEQQQELFVKNYGKNRSTAIKVFQQDKTYRDEFERRLNKIAVYAAEDNQNVAFIELNEDSELDYIPRAKEEILNYVNRD